jgi:hypothetical protein
MAERLSQEITQLLAEPDGDGSRQGRTDALVRARLIAGIAEGLDESPRAEAAGACDPMRLAALLDHGLPPDERDAILAALAHDPVGRAELSSAAELVNAVNSKSQALPPRLLARAFETFGDVPPRSRPATALWPSARPKWTSSRRVLSLAAVLLVAVMTPVALLVIGDGSNRSNGPPERSLSDSGAGKKAVPAPKRTMPLTSCDDKGAVAQPGEAGKPERAESTSAPADDPCRPKPPALDNGATAPPPPAPN